MKLLLCLLLVAVAVTAQVTLTDEQKANWRKWSGECQVETGATQEAINQIRTNQFDAVTDPKIKAHGLCFAKKTGLANDAGNLDVDKLKAKLKKVESDDAKVDEIVKKCLVEKNTKEETVFELFKCVRQNKPLFNPV